MSAALQERRQAFAERRAARVARLERAASRARADGQASLDRADRISDGIPLGQPILVGHHSERRARRDQQRIHDGLRRGFERLNEAKDLERRASAAEQNQAISSDDPDAVAKLESEVEREEAFRARWKLINAALRKPDRESMLAALDALAPFTEDEKRTIKHSASGTGYVLTNAAGRIRRLKQRIAELQAKASKPAVEFETIGDVRLERDRQDNRVRIIFPAKPSPDVISKLKASGFRWAPSAGAWQRHESEAAMHAARSIAAALPSYHQVKRSDGKVVDVCVPGREA